ncbi:MAG: heparan-alpha-glucosaminide N-acetyltransferase [Desulfotomaculaceae bacterium]|nr:heparan-alpha-glucosaminide N-acetyltransferase [Desulfotomaculaceae bacterium]
MGEKRIWEIDLLRATAIILMVIFHIVVDLNKLVGIDIDYFSGFWFWEGKISALIFIFLAGISSGFSKNTVTRGIKVLSYGMAITFFTYIFFREQYIIFGILHLLGTSMIIFPLFKRIDNILLFISAIIVALAAIPLNNIFTNTSLLIPFGITCKGLATLDYYPLIPYFSVFILGILAYKMYYHKKQSLCKSNFENKYIRTISKSSLLIYLVHQPVIIATIILFKSLTSS